VIISSLYGAAAPTRYVSKMESKLAFFRRRAAEEHLAHANATHADDQRDHLGLAKQYETLALAESKPGRFKAEAALDEALLPGQPR
jgi:hypothetical protein